ncbi:Imm7 family immunity protein [Kribbella sp. NPDC049227]|uniref:Imm7 family immunity protein n=1 Tax=Kribbella sp. NPDC049227 TaxID=3364113 RepID=UPI003711590E
MFEWHGWAVVVPSPGAEDDEDADNRSVGILSAVQKYLDEQAPVVNEVLDWRWQNGQMHVWVAGCHNHPTTKPHDVLTRISLLAPAATGCFTRSITVSMTTGRAECCDEAPSRSRSRKHFRPTWAQSRTRIPAPARGWFMARR